MARGAEGRRTEGGDVDAKYELARKQSMLLTLGAGAGGTPSKGMAMKGGTNARGGGREAYPFGFSADSAPSLSDFPEATPGAAEGFRQLEKGGALPGSAGPGAGAGERQSDNSQLANQSNQSNHSQSPAAAAHLSSGHRHSISNGSYSLNMHNVHSTGDAGPRSPPAAPPPLADTHDGGVFSVGGERDELYFLGIIDISTPWNSRKQAEQLLKGLVHDRHQISAVPPSEYASRFMSFIEKTIA